MATLSKIVLVKIISATLSKIVKVKNPLLLKFYEPVDERIFSSATRVEVMFSPIVVETNPSQVTSPLAQCHLMRPWQHCSAVQ